MLSYDNSLSVNGKTPTSPANLPAMSATRTAMPASKTVPNGFTSPGSALTPNDHHGTHHDHQIWLVTGPAGSGKSTVAKYLASCLNYPYIEGDEFHPKANIEKMSAGVPLTDADRWDWLTALREESIRQISAGGHDGVVLTCSALKRKYRDVIRVAPYFNTGVHLHFIYLHASEEVLLQRVAARKDHYMGANMVQSQFDILEPPMADEVDVVSVDVSRSMDEVKSDALAKVVKIIEEEEKLQLQLQRGAGAKEL